MAFDAAYIKMSLFKAFEIHELRSQSTTLLISHSLATHGKEEFLSQNPNFALLVTMLLLEICYILATASTTAQLYEHGCYNVTIASFFIMICVSTFVTDLNSSKLQDKSPTSRICICLGLVLIGLSCLSVDRFVETGEFFSCLAITSEVFLTAGMNILLGAVNMNLANTEVNLLNFKQIEFKRNPVLIAGEVVAFILLACFSFSMESPYAISSINITLWTMVLASTIVLLVASKVQPIKRQGQASTN